MAPGLEIRDIAKSFGPVPVLQGLSLDAPPGRLSALIGQNGAGKTTLFRILMGLLKPASGTATVDGNDILLLPLQEKARAGIGYLPQECASFEELTVRQNLLALLEILCRSKPERLQRLEQLLALTDIEKIADRRYHVLSGGEKRRLEIAKALASRPRVLLLDEPFSGLDPAVVEDLAGILTQLANDGMALLLTDHNVHMVLSFVDYIYLLGPGKIVCQGTPREIAANETARKIYLGQGFVLPKAGA